MNSQKHLFDLDPEITYLNCAYMSPLMKSVAEAGYKGIQRKLRPNLTSGEDFFTESEALRGEFAKLINAADPKQVVIIPSVSYGFGNVAKNLKLSPGDEILVVDEQFPSNVYPWMRVAKEAGATIRTIAPPEHRRDRGKAWNEAILDAINSRTKLVSCGHIHWADGTLFNLSSISKKAKKVGAWLAIDATQSLGALPFDVQEIQPDALIAAGYKSLMGPYSIGLAYYSQTLNDGIPIEENWINRKESRDFTNLANYTEEYEPGAQRFEVGERSNFILLPMMLEALSVLNRLTPSAVKAYLDNLVEEPIKRLQQAGFIIEEKAFRVSNLFGVRLPDTMTMKEAKDRLSRAGVFVSYRGKAIRVAPNMYNTIEDLEKLVAALTTD